MLWMGISVATEARSQTRMHSTDVRSRVQKQSAIQAQHQTKSIVLRPSWQWRIKWVNFITFTPKIIYRTLARIFDRRRGFARRVSLPLRALLFLRSNPVPAPLPARLRLQDHDHSLLHRPHLQAPQVRIILSCNEWSIVQNCSYKLGSGCASFGRTVASYTRDPRFE